MDEGDVGSTEWTAAQGQPPNEESEVDDNEAALAAAQREKLIKEIIGLQQNLKDEES
ncbi:hypothetical protein PCANC_01303 [Puccinia coronata f. sp. avenae]|uniref:Uncharacterized protein n=1 Tax=Puccinia coronata f. sp. avenae TaxID=200324 RepID=A0A2N5W3K1_9BASI|nr:hypothetical protein PCANC_01303 [Puccinia coronata f. sp. avenae]